MAQRHIVFRPATQPGDVARQLTARFEAVRREFEVPDGFPPAVLAEAAAAAGAARLPERDETDIPFVTIDPPTSMDLDQAMSIERQGDGYRVRYAIADVPAFVRAGGAVDSEARRRGQTVYCPDERVLLHPKELSEGAASLLPDEVLLLLKEVGEKRIALERKRGGASLPMPEQEVQEDGSGGFTISFRPLLA